jgi:hypothetical protein
MASLRPQVGQMALGAPKRAAWKITVAIMGLPILGVIGPTLFTLLRGASPDWRTESGGLGALILIFLPTWIALFLNHRHVLLIFLSNVFCVLISVLCAFDMSVFNWAGLGGDVWWSLLGWQAALIWSFIDNKRPDAPELDPSAPPISSPTPVST